ncbi:hypothetical protein CPC08DRAFT_323609 [Agrocybe pediades]|nr:hypothetical protein CPC08DRAFT_323609 [Agrocybe pediades]
MPKVSQSTQSSVNDTLFLYKYQTKRVLGRRQLSYQDALTTCRKLFPNIASSDQITLHTNELEICEGEMTEIPEEMWEDVVGALRSVTIVTVEGRAFLPSPSVEPQAPVETSKHSN